MTREPPNVVPALDRSADAAPTLPGLHGLQDSTFSAVFEARGRAHPDKLVFTWLSDAIDTDPYEMTYGALLRSAHRIAAAIVSQVQPGTRAVLFYQPGADYIAAFLGCLLAGVIAVPCYPPRNRRGAERIESILADCTPSLAMTSTGSADALRKLVQCDQWLETSSDDPGTAYDTGAPIHVAAADDLAFLQYTSGSTGTPKGVMISHRNLLADAALIQSAFSLDETSVGGTWLPPYHDMGLIGGLLEVIYLGIHSVVMAPNMFLQKPFAWLKAISDYRVTHSGAPNFAYDLCVSRITDPQKQTLDLSSWSAAYCGAEPIRPHTLDRFADAFGACGFQRNAFLTCYGLAEATLMVSSARRGEGPLLGAHDDEPDKTLVSCGVPVTEQMRIVDPHTCVALDKGQVGEIWVAGPNVARGYWGNEAETRENFDARIAVAPQAANGANAQQDNPLDGPFMRTGDLGFVRDGQLFVNGRIKDLIILNGRNIYPQDVEAAAFGSHDALRIDSAAAFTTERDGVEQLVIVQELDFRRSADESMFGCIAQAVFEHIGVQPSTLVLVKAGTVPRTSSGKIRRRQCKADFDSGALPELLRHERSSAQKPGYVRADVPDASEAADDIAQAAVRGALQPAGQDKTAISSVSPNTAAIVEWLCTRLETRLNLAPRSIDPAQSFFYYGVDSIQAVEACGALAEWLDRPVEPTLFWDYPTPAELARHLSGESLAATSDDAAHADAQTPRHRASDHDAHAEPIAIVGLGCRFPGADSPAAFWQMLHDGVDAVREVPPMRTAAGSFHDSADASIAHTRIAGFLDEVDRFDGDLFGIAPVEAVRIDPQQRLVLEVAWEALEHAGIAPSTLAGSQTGVFVGVSSHDYDEIRSASHTDLSLYDATGSSFSVVANRLSYLLDLRGPSLAIDTACSSSLVAVHLACRSLQSGESRVAIAGGVNLILSSTSSEPFARSGLLSPDGRSKAFDDSANGYVRGEGCGMVVLKRLSDAERDGDPVHAVIVGSAVHQDGRSNGLAAPNGIAQTEVIRQALANARLRPAALEHIEAHGTGTALGDPVELNALKAVLHGSETERERPCVVSSVKTNIGHLEAAAGIAGLIKTVLALEHDTMPAHLHFRQLNRHCSLDGAPLEVGSAARAWPRTQRRFAGVSSFGFGGTLAHLVLADAPDAHVTSAQVQDGHDASVAVTVDEFDEAPQLLVWSAKTPAALDLMTCRIAQRLVQSSLPESARPESGTERNARLYTSSDGSLADIAYSLQTGRNAFAYRRALVTTDRLDAAAKLDRRDPAQWIDTLTNARTEPAAVFMFPGQGAQRVGMAHDLYRRFPVFRTVFDACADGFTPRIGVDLRELLFGRAELGKDASNAAHVDERSHRLEQTALAQPALFAVEYACAQLLISLGVRPRAMIGHSVGEYVAACVAGVFAFDDALDVIALRGRLMQAQPSGAMASVALGETALNDVLQHYARDGLSLAAVNSTGRCVVAGETARVDALIADLTARDVPCKRLHVSHAFHSALMEGACEPFRDALSRLTLNAPSTPFVSNVTGDWITDADAVDPAYWARHLREPVRFAAGLATLGERFGASTLLLEVGPGNALQTFARQCAYRDGGAPSLVLPVLGEPAAQPAGAASANPAIIRPTQSAQSTQPIAADAKTLLTSLGKLWGAGHPLDWAALHRGERRRRVPLPTYPFDRQRHWLRRSTEAVSVLEAAPMSSSIPRDPAAHSTHQATHQASDAMPASAFVRDEAVALQPQPQPRRERILAKLRTLVAGLLQVEPERVNPHAALLELGADSLVLVQAVRRLEEMFGVAVTIRQLFEELTSIAELAAYMDRHLPATWDDGEGTATVNAAAVFHAQAAQAVATTATAATTQPATPSAAQAHVASVAHVMPASTQAFSASPGMASATHTASAASTSTAVENVIAQQLDVMRLQLSLMGSTASTSAQAPALLPAAGATTNATNALTTPAHTAGAALPTFAATPPAAHPAQPAHAPQPSFDPYGKLAAPQKAYVQRFVADLLNRTAKSKAHTQQYRGVIADYRALAGFRFSAKDPILPLSLSELFYPIVAARAEGAHLIDVDGNEYVDLAMGFGVALFGHSAPFIRDAIRAQLDDGMHLGPESPLTGEVAAMVSQLTGMERVAFCNSGTEAVMLAVRLARTRNKRPKIAQFTGSYHGWADGMLVAADPERDPYAVAAAPGLQTGSGEQALVLEYGSAHALQMIREHAHELSAVLVEPVQSRRPEWQPKAFLHDLRALTKELGITLIFDEMITGFRLHPGGAQAWFDVRADLVVYGKAAGGGMPIGIVAGDRALMNGIDGGAGATLANAANAAGVDTTFFAGTFCKHPLALASTHASLTKMIDSGPSLQADLTRRTDALIARLNRLFTEHVLPMQMVNCGSLFRLHCLHNLDLFCYHLIANGLYVWEGRTMYLSTAHTDADVDFIYEAFAASARALIDAGFFPGAKPVPPGPDGGRRVAQSEITPPSARLETAHASTVAHAALAVAPPVTSSTASAHVPVKTPAFSLSFFGTYDAGYQQNKYDLLFDAAHFADEHRFAALWLPERHFHAFGGLSPNPSVLAAALARETRHIDLRAGSVVLPLHHPVRVAEEWSVVDNLSNGRVGIAVASGWHPNDFVFAPEAFGTHRDLTFERLGQIQRLWSGEALDLPDGSGQPFAAALYPMPRQKRLPVWVTVVSNPDTYRKAAELGAGILTNLMGQSVDELARNIALYRRTLADRGHDPQLGKVTVLLHTFVGANREAARRDAREPFLDYLKASVGLFQNMARALGVAVDSSMKPEDEAYLLSVAYDRYTATSALIGDPASCAEIVRKLAAIGVDEIGCFIDFGVDAHAVRANLPYLQQVRELVAQRDAEAVSAIAGVDTRAGQANTTEVWPASTAQRWLWLDHQRDASNSAHCIAAIVELPRDVAAGSLDRALTQIVARHEVLRTTFEQRDEDVVQRVGHADAVHVATGQADTEAHAHQRLAALSAEPFDLERGPLFRALRVDLADGRRLLLWCMHEIVADGASAVLLQEEITALMNADANGAANPLPPLAMQYRDYALKQREQLDSASHAARDYWHRQLALPLPVLDLPFDTPLTASTPATGARLERVIDGAAYVRLQALLRTRHSTLFMFLQAAVAAWLARLSGQHDVVIAAPVGARVLPGTEQLIGFFLNTVLMRHRVNATETFGELLRRARTTVFDGLEHQDYPFEQLIDALNPPRVRNAFPVTPVMLNVLNYRGAAAAEAQFWSGALNMKAELELYASEQDGALRLVCHYRSGLISERTADYLLDQLVHLLAQIVDEPERRIGDFDLFAQQHAVLHSRYLRFVEPLETSGAQTAGRALETLVSRIAAHVRHTPDATALDSDHGALSYAALWAQSGATLHAWRDELGLQRGDVLALMVRDRVQHVIGVLAGFRAGAIVTPFSANEPLPRQRAMIDAVEPALWVIDASTLDRLIELHAERPLKVAIWGEPDASAQPLPAAWQVRWLATGAMQAGHDGQGGAHDTAPEAGLDPRAPAYIFFTSGSTGEPKPIVGRADSLAQFVGWEIDEFALDATVRVSQLASLTFDASLRDMFVPLCAGGVLCVPPHATRDFEPEALLDWLDAKRVSLVHTVPSVFRVWLPLLRGAARFDTLAHLLLSGEPLLPNDVKRWHDALGTRVQLVNLYGATETTLIKCFYRIGAADATREFIPVGRPMPGTRAIVLDANRQICAPGVTGELWLRTAYGTLGYYKQPQRTAEVFVSDLFDAAGLRLNDSEIVYRTGDLATWLDDGTLRVLGRRDMQVKVHGVRVEPEEIENALYAHGGIELAAVVAVAGPAAREGETVLHAYYTATGALAPDSIKQYLMQRLPAEMVPTSIERRATLPLTASGKVDRRALSLTLNDTQVSTEAVFEAPQGDLEAALATLFEQVLELPRVGRHDNFFELGGHSLRALRAISRIRKVFGVELAPDRFFDTATPAALAHEVEILRDAQFGSREASNPPSDQASTQPQRAGQIPPVRARASGAPLPLSFEQERVWTQETLGLAGTGYSIPVALTLAGQLDIGALERSLSELVRRHEILRTHFDTIDGHTHQVVDAAQTVPLRIIDLSGLDDAAQRADLDALLRHEIDQPFDLGTGPLLRASLARLAPARHVVLLNMHHIVSDGWSADVLVREVGALYAAFSTGQPSPLAELSVQYGDYALWQRDWLQGALLDQQLDYWKTALNGAPAALDLPTDRPRPAEQSFRGAKTRFALSAPLTAQLTTLGQQNGATLYMVLLAAFSMLLGRYSGQDDIVIGAPIAGRRAQELEGLIGFFINTLALRTDLNGEPSFAELVARVKKTALSAYAHQDLPFEKLVAQLQPVRDLSRQPVFQVVFGFQQATQSFALPGLDIAQLESDAMAVKFDLSLQMHQGPTGIDCAVEYATDLFDRASVERLIGHYVNLLAAVVVEPQRRIGTLRLLGDDERAVVLSEWNRTGADYPRGAEASVQALFEAQVRRTPDAAALVFGGESVSYTSLNARANRLAHALIERGVGAESRVAICVKRGVDMVVGLLGVLKAGAAYVPLDPSYPAQRLAYMLEDSKPVALLTQSAVRDTLPPHPVDTFCLDSDWHALEGLPESDPVNRTLRSHLAYMIYTSGSTGQPKGVMIAHGGLSNYLHWALDAYSPAPQKGSVVSSSLSFDATITSLWTPLLCGGTVTLLSEGDEIAGLENYVQHGRGLVKITPAHLDALGRRLQAEGATSQVDVFVIGGEALAASTVALWQDLQPGVRLVNEYGPTETVVGCIVHDAQTLPSNAVNVPVGKPLANTRIYLLDASGEPVPVGVAGEIHIAGEGVARGYLNRAALTAERFIPDPFAASGARMYRTGDLARYLADGTIEYLGRNDEQVKLRGFRIELGEIEAKLAKHPDVRDVVVIAREDTPGEKRLVAYYTKAHTSTEALDVDTLREHLLANLPDYMVPAAYVHLDALPLTPNGKVDRKSLPEPGATASKQTAYVAPQGDIETTLAQIWRDVLKVDQVGRHDNFFELGGHSLLAIKLFSLMRKAGLAADVRALFNAPTLAALAQTVGGASGQVDVPPNAIPADVQTITPAMLPLVSLTAAEIAKIAASVPGGEANIQDIYPLAPLQEGVLFHHLMAKEGDPYLLNTLFTFDNRERLDAFVDALQKVIARHDILRTAVHWEGLAEPVQVVWRDAPIRIDEIDLGNVGGDDLVAQLQTRFDARQQRLDLSQAPLMRAVIASEKRASENRTDENRTDSGRWAMQILFHHLAIDHTALDGVAREVNAYLLDPHASLPAPVPFRNYVAQARLGVSREEHEAYFRTLLGDVDEATLPFGLQDVQGEGHGIVETRLELDTTLADSLRRHARELGVSAASLFHLAWAQVVGCASNRDDVVFGTVLFGRLQGGAGSERALGMFINTLPVRLKLDRGARDSVRQTHATLTQLLRHEHAPLALAQQCSGVQAPAPLFSALLNYRYDDTAPDAGTTGQAWSGIENVRSEERTNYPLTLSVDDRQQGFGLMVHVDSRLDGARIARYVEQALRSLSDALERQSHDAVRTLTVLPPAEREQLVHGWNRTTTDYPRDASLPELFEAQVRRAPDAIAVVEGERSLTYAELNAQANRLAHDLIAQGVVAETRVALLLDRSIDIVVSEIAVVKCGAVYVPLDSHAPPDRQRFMLEDCGAKLLLTHRSLASPDIAGVQRIELDGPAAASRLAGQPVHDPVVHKLSALASAYIMYTSGSTGTPKGVLVPHRGIVRLVRNERFASFGPDDRFGFVSNPAFDVSTFDVWAPLLNGGRTVVIDQETLLSPPALRDAFLTHGVDVVFLTVGLFDQSADTLMTAFSRMRCLLVGGDALTPAVIARVLKHGAPRQLINGYGPTEATTFAVTHQLDLSRGVAGSVPIGRPMSNTLAYVLDASSEPVPVDVAGELYLGGDALAHGYLNRAGLTAERFLPDPFGAPGARMYRTGDLACYRQDGTIDYLGRNDEQVKLRGFRVELGEIRERLIQHAGVRDAVVVVRADDTQGKRLVAYYTSHDAGNDAGNDAAAQSRPDGEALRAHLLAQLPDYMVPVAYVELAALPLTLNGKLDRKALPAPDESAYARSGYEAPQGEIETTLARIWGDVLGVGNVGRHGNFFELGGHSLLAISVIEQMRQAGLHTDVRTLFGAPTLSALAAAIATTNNAPAAIEVPPNAIPFACDAIEPHMLPLVQLSHAQIATLVDSVPGGAPNVQDIYPLAPLQEGVLFHHLMAEQGDPYLLNTLFAFDDRARLDAFVGALQQVIARHDILRTAVHWKGLPAPVQIVWRDAPIRIDEVELDLTSAEDAGQQLRSRFDPRRMKLDLGLAPLMRVAIAFDASSGRWLMLVLFHHLALDHTALDSVEREVRAFLLGVPERLAAPVPFRNYVAQARLGVSREEHETFFREMLGDIDEPTLPFGLQDTQGEGHDIGETKRELDPALAQRLRRQARELGVSAASLFHLAWAQVLGRTSDRPAAGSASRDDVVFGTVLFGRLQGGAGADRALGMFINTLPVRIGLGGGVRDGVRQTHTVLTQLLRHEHAPLALAQQCSGVQAPTPLFSALLNYRYDATDQYSDEAQNAWQGIESLSSEERTNYPLTLSVDDLGDGFRMTLLTAAPLDGARIGGYVEQALHGIADALDQQPTRRLRDLPILPAAERAALLQGGNSGRAELAHGDCLHVQFEAQARRTPDAIAVEFEAESLSYGELNARANRVAHALRARGVGVSQGAGHDANTRVALCVERGPALLVGVLGILKAGGAYVPLDPAYPAHRLAFLLDDSAPAVLVTQPSLLDTLPARGDTHAVRDTLLIDAHGVAESGEDLSGDDLPSVTVPDHLAYVIYTSGSTGQPKGVTVTHRNVARLFAATQADFGFSSDDVWTLFHSFAFDFSVWEMWGALLFGGRVVIVPKTVAQSAETFYTLLCERGVTVLNQTPSAFRQLIAAQRASGAAHSLRHVVFGGEALDTAMLKPWYDDPRNAATPLVNMYGITETTVHVSYRPLDAADAQRAGSSPIGRPLADLGAYLLDDAREPVPQGVAGELYIAGAGLARGYLNRPDLSAERFVPDPFGAPGARLYRTGDLARCLADGSLEYLGRNDEQVKLRGFRIEPGEIAAKLAQHPAIDDALVLARDDGQGKRLVAYYTLKMANGEAAASGGVAGEVSAEATGESLRAHLRADLPHYMVPAAYVKLDTWPLTANGKLDRRALPAPDGEAYARRAYEAPQGDIEIKLARIWGDVLNAGRVGRHDNFFELGGHSLLAITLTERMREANLHVDIRALFGAPTLAALAEAVGDKPEEIVVVPPNRIPSASPGKARPDAPRKRELRI